MRKFGLSQFLAWLTCLISIIGPTLPAAAQGSAKAATGAPLHVSVLVNSGSDQPCYTNGRLAALNRLLELAEDDINAAGGIHGRRIEAHIMDSAGQLSSFDENIEQSLADPERLAMIGGPSDFYARLMLARLKDKLTTVQMPFITNLSDRNIFRDFPSLFSTQPSQADEGIPIIARFIKEKGYFKKVGFVGNADDSQSTRIGSDLWARLTSERLAWDHRIKLDGALASTEQLNEVVKIAQKPQPAEDGKTELTSLIVVDLSPDNASQLIKALNSTNLKPAIFFMGDIDRLSQKVVSTYPNAIYQLVWDRPPEVYSNNIIELVSEEKPDQGLFAGRVSLNRIPEVIKNRLREWDNPEPQRQWVFAGRKNPGAPGWSDAEETCAKQSKPIITDPLQAENLQAIAAAAQYADVLKLIVTAARTAGPGAKIEARRAAVVSELKQAYADGKGAFKGRLRNWSFSPGHRTATRKPFVVILPHTIGRKQLADVQFARTKNAKLRKIDTLYLDIDLIRAHSIDDNRKSFLADFYVAMRGGNNATVQSLDFTNAYLDPRTGGRQISIQTLHGGGPSAYFPDAMRIYRVSGRFLFDPKLANYPFDSQHFTIDIRPNSSNERPFIVQPPPLRLRDKQLTTDGWILKNQYVGYAADFVPVVDAYTHEPSAIPFYTASFVWKMKRETTDYFLRVVVPLAFILIVAYLSIFIPQSHLEAIVTIQITALLSAVALYLSLPKLEADTATISDRIFVFDYMMVSFMIVISILRINKRIATLKWVDGVLSFIHIFIIPIIVLLMVYSVYQVSVLST